MVQEAIKCKCGNCVGVSPDLFGHDLQFNTQCWTGGREKITQEKKPNQLLGSPLTKEPEKQETGKISDTQFGADDGDVKQEVQTSLPAQQLVVIIIFIISRPVVHHFPLAAAFCPRTRKHHTALLPFHLLCCLMNTWCRSVYSPSR